MAHLHWCDVTGHEWECQGAALRPLRGDTEPTPCYCINHQTLMEDGEVHSRCSIELIACPEHRGVQQAPMGSGSMPAEEASIAEPEESSMFKDQEGNPIVGFCLWCDKNFYTMDEEEVHTADGMAQCAVFQELKDKNCEPPVLQYMFQQAELLDGESDGKARDRHGREEEK
jgi:hypothetical protein